MDKGLVLLIIFSEQSFFSVPYNSPDWGAKGIWHSPEAASHSTYGDAAEDKLKNASTLLVVSRRFSIQKGSPYCST